MGGWARWAGAVALGMLGSTPVGAQTDPYVATRDAAVEWSREAHADEQARRAALGAAARQWLVSPEAAGERARESTRLPERLAVEAAPPAAPPEVQAAAPPSDTQAIRAGETPPAPSPVADSPRLLAGALAWARSLREARPEPPSPLANGPASEWTEVAGAMARLMGGIRGWILGDTPERRAPVVAASGSPPRGRDAPAQLASSAESTTLGASADAEPVLLHATPVDPSKQGRSAPTPRPAAARTARQPVVVAERTHEPIPLPKPRPEAAPATRPASPEATVEARAPAPNGPAPISASASPRADPREAAARTSVASPTAGVRSKPAASLTAGSGPKPVARRTGTAGSKPMARRMEKPVASAGRSTARAPATGKDRIATGAPGRRRQRADKPAVSARPAIVAARPAPAGPARGQAVSVSPRPSPPRVGSIPRRASGSDEAWRVRARKLAQAEIARARETQARLMATRPQRVVAASAPLRRAGQPAPRRPERHPPIPDHPHDAACEHPLGWALVEECDEWGCGLYEEYCDERGCILHALDFFFAGP